jgi:hypothetical protein
MKLVREYGWRPGVGERVYTPEGAQVEVVGPGIDHDSLKVTAIEDERYRRRWPWEPGYAVNYPIHQLDREEK